MSFASTARAASLVFGYAASPPAASGASRSIPWARRLHRFALSLFVSTVAACASVPGEAPASGHEPFVRTWGSMRTVLREGRTEGRIELAPVVGPDTIAVGALAGLAAEITVSKGEVYLAEVDALDPSGVRRREAANGDSATLLVLADVAHWHSYALPEIPTLAAFEAHVRELAQAHGLDATRPFPFRVEGRAREIGLHVLDHSCPVSHPQGPPPWRWTGSSEPVRLVGFHADDAAGELTHHGQASHTHVILESRGWSGHVDGLALEAGARLELPAAPLSTADGQESVDGVRRMPGRRPPLW